MIIMILMMILHMDDNKIMLIEMLSFPNDLFIYFLCFRGVYAVVMCFWRTKGVYSVCLKCLFKVFVLPEFEVWDVMYSGMLYNMVKYCFNKCFKK